MPCSNDLCERYGQHREEWHKKEEETMELKHGEKMVDRIAVQYLCRPCPECKDKLEVAKKLAVAARGVIQDCKETHFSVGADLADSICVFLQAALTAWDQAGK